MDSLNGIQADARQAETYRLMGNYEDALDIFNKVIKQCPTYAWAWAHRGATYLDRARATNGDPKKSDLKNALNDLTEAIKQDGNYAWALANRGDAHCLNADHQNALGDFQQAITLDAGYAWAYAHRGAAYLKWFCKDQNVSHLDNAIDNFDTAIAKNEQYAWAWAFRGVAYYLRGHASGQADDYKHAFEDAIYAVTLDPNIYGKAGRIDAEGNTLPSHLRNLAQRINS